MSLFIEIQLRVASILEQAMAQLEDARALEGMARGERLAGEATGDAAATALSGALLGGLEDGGGGASGLLVPQKEIEPAGSPRGKTDLTLYVVYYGGDARLWVQNANGAGGWRYVGKYYDPYPESDEDNPWFDFYNYVVGNRSTFESLTGKTAISKSWSPKYGDKGSLGDWYDFRRDATASYSVIVGDSDDPDAQSQLYVDFTAPGSGKGGNDIDFEWLATGNGELTALCYAYQYSAWAQQYFVRVTEQAQTVRYWAWPVWSSSSSGPNNADWFRYTIDKSKVVTAPTSREAQGIVSPVSASVVSGSYEVVLSSVLFRPNLLGGSTGSCQDVTYGGNTCPFEEEPPKFTWGRWGWPERKHQDDDVLGDTYRAVNPFTIGRYKWKYDQIWNSFEYGGEFDSPYSEFLHWMLGEGHLVGDHSYTFSANGTERQSTEYRDSWLAAIQHLSSLGISKVTGVDRDSLNDYWWKEKIYFEYANPYYAMATVMADGFDAEPGLPLEERPLPMPPPEYGWKFDRTKGGFMLEFGPPDYSQDQWEKGRLQALLDSGVLHFDRDDGKKTSIKVGGTLDGVPDGIPEWGSYGFVLVDEWGQSGKTRALAQAAGLR